MTTPIKRKAPEVIVEYDVSPEAEVAYVGAIKILLERAIQLARSEPDFARRHLADAPSQAPDRGAEDAAP